MTYIHIPALRRFRCVICGQPTDQRHHLTYDRRLEYDDRFDRLPLCEGHHVDLHRLLDHLDRKVSLPLFSAWYTNSPVLTVQQVNAIRPGPLQLDIGQQNTPQGQVWRDWEADYQRFLENYWNLQDVA